MVWTVVQEVFRRVMLTVSKVARAGASIMKVCEHAVSESSVFSCNGLRNWWQKAYLPLCSEVFLLVSSLLPFFHFQNGLGL